MNPLMHLTSGFCTTSTHINFFVFSEAAEQLYATQLSQLQEMGFFDTQENIRALVATSGDVHAAIQRLSRNSNQL